MEEDYFGNLREMEKEMLKIDMHRHLGMPPSLNEWIEMFGQPTDEDLSDITQVYMKNYHHYGDEYIPELVSAYDINWVNTLLTYNEEIEEYELCAIIKQHLDVYKKEIRTSK